MLTRKRKCLIVCYASVSPPIRSSGTIEWQRHQCTCIHAYTHTEHEGMSAGTGHGGGWAQGQRNCEPVCGEGTVSQGGQERLHSSEQVSRKTWSKWGNELLPIWGVGENISWWSCSPFITKMEASSHGVSIARQGACNPVGVYKVPERTLVFILVRREAGRKLGNGVAWCQLGFERPGRR